MIDRIEIAIYLFIAVLVLGLLLAEPIHRAWVNFFWREKDGKFVRRKFFRRQ